MKTNPKLAGPALGTWPVHSDFSATLAFGRALTPLDSVSPLGWVSLGHFSCSLQFIFDVFTLAYHSGAALRSGFASKLDGSDRRKKMLAAKPLLL